jgi:chorismate mutase
MSDLAGNLPAAAACGLGRTAVPLPGAAEIGVPDRLETSRLTAQPVIEQIYLRGATGLRPDLVRAAIRPPAELGDGAERKPQAW